MKRFLVTGASGLIGSALCEALLARGDEVVGLSRDPIAATERNPRVHWYGWEPAMERPPAEALDGVDGVVNLTGEPIDQRWTPESKQRILDSRIVATRNLVDAIGSREDRPDVLVSGSAIGYYGDRGADILDESSAPADDFAAEVTTGWEAAAAPVEDSGVRLVILRTGLVLDRSGGMLKRLLAPFRLGVGGPIAGGEQFMSWIHVDDEVGLILWALDRDEVSGAVNAIAPNPVTNRQFSKELGRALGRPVFLTVPGIALDALFGREFAATLKGGQRVFPRRASDLGYRFRHPDLPEALNALL